MAIWTYFHNFRLPTAYSFEAQFCFAITSIMWYTNTIILVLTKYNQEYSHDAMMWLCNPTVIIVSIMVRLQVVVTIVVHLQVGPRKGDRYSPTFGGSCTSCSHLSNRMNHVAGALFHLWRVSRIFEILGRAYQPTKYLTTSHPVFSR
jgi:hypothetical protein